jgi:hypothetical protein
VKGQAYNEGLGAINVKVGTQQTNIIVHSKQGWNFETEQVHLDLKLGSI